MTNKEEYLIGMDVGSTTTKIVVLQKSDEKIIYSEYARHHAELAKSVCTLLEHGKKSIPEGGAVRIAFTGSLLPARDPSLWLTRPAFLLSRRSWQTRWLS